MYNKKLKINFPDLHGVRIDLIAISEAGLIDMHEYSMMPDFYAYLEYEPFKSIDETKSYLRRLIHLSKFGNGYYWFIKLNKENKIIGTFDVINIDMNRLSCEIGYGLSPKYWRQGFFKESLDVVLRYLFASLNLYRVFAKTHSDNKPSIVGLERIGFKKEGVLRDFYLSSDMKRHDATILSILKHEFH